jgi:predicted nuclease of predicted toxin-antitoxin system
MRVLLDTCISRLAPAIVREAGHDVTWAGDWPADPGDEEILRRAAAEGRVLATIDKDFGELVIVQGMLHVGLIRLVGFRARYQGPALVRLLSTYEAELGQGAILTAEPWRVRVRAGSDFATPRRPRAKIETLSFSITGAIPPNDVSNNRVFSAVWPLPFAFEFDARFDRPVVATSASIEVIAETSNERVARRVVMIDQPASDPTVQEWHGVIPAVAIPCVGHYRIVIEIDDVEPFITPFQFEQK